MVTTKLKFKKALEAELTTGTVLLSNFSEEVQETTGREKRTWSPARRKAQELRKLNKISEGAAGSKEPKSWSSARRASQLKAKGVREAKNLLEKLAKESEEQAPRRWTKARRKAQELKTKSSTLGTTSLQAEATVDQKIKTKTKLKAAWQSPTESAEEVTLRIQKEIADGAIRAATATERWRLNPPEKQAVDFFAREDAKRRAIVFNCRGSRKNKKWLKTKVALLQALGYLKKERRRYLIRRKFLTPIRLLRSKKHSRSKRWPPRRVTVPKPGGGNTKWWSKISYVWYRRHLYSKNKRRKYLKRCSASANLSVRHKFLKHLVTFKRIYRRRKLLGLHLSRKKRSAPQRLPWEQRWVRYILAKTVARLRLLDRLANLNKDTVLFSRMHILPEWELDLDSAMTMGVNDTLLAALQDLCRVYIDNYAVRKCPTFFELIPEIVETVRFVDNSNYWKPDSNELEDGTEEEFGNWSDEELMSYTVNVEPTKPTKKRTEAASPETSLKRRRAFYFSKRWLHWTSDTQYVLELTCALVPKWQLTTAAIPQCCDYRIYSAGVAANFTEIQQAFRKTPVFPLAEGDRKELKKVLWYTKQGRACFRFRDRRRPRRLPRSKKRVQPLALYSKDNTNPSFRFSRKPEIILLPSCAVANCRSFILRESGYSLFRHLKMLYTPAERREQNRLTPFNEDPTDDLLDGLLGACAGYEGKSEEIISYPENTRDKSRIITLIDNQAGFNYDQPAYLNDAYNYEARWRRFCAMLEYEMELAELHLAQEEEYQAEKKADREIKRLAKSQKPDGWSPARRLAYELKKEARRLLEEKAGLRPRLTMGVQGIREDPINDETTNTTSNEEQETASS